MTACPDGLRLPATAASPEDERTFDRNKGAIYATYVRGLKKNPGLKGRIAFEIGIAASGRVEKCRVVSSDMRAPALENQLCERIGRFQFSARPAAVTFMKEVQFFPSG